MHLRILGLSATMLAVAAGSALAATTIIGNVSQSNSQAVNSSQSALNGAGGGATYILGGSSPTVNQNSSNVLVNVQTIGGGAGPCNLGPPYCSPATTNFTLIGNASQVNQQAVNSQQVASNGRAGTGAGTTFIGGSSSPTLNQNSFNLLINDVILGP